MQTIKETSAKHNNILAVTGMTGVGKDFLVKEANTDIALSVINLGTLIGQKLNMDRDLMMQAVDAEHMRSTQLAVYHEVIRKQPLIVTCHTIRFMNGTYTYDLEIEQLFKPRYYVFVAAPPEVIAQRVHDRNLNTGRKSQELSIPKIAELQDIKLQQFKILTELLGCQSLIISNTVEVTAHNGALLRQRIESMRQPNE